MNLTVELVKHWGLYEEKHPDASLADFCRYYLITEREHASKGIHLDGVVPMHVNGILLKTIGRIAKMNGAFASIAFEGTGIQQLEEFGMLLTVSSRVNPKKSEIIYSNVQELSSGTVMLNRLLDGGLIQDYADEHDKRSKRVKLTAKGEMVIEACTQRIGKFTEIMLNEMDDDDKALCIQLLKNVEIKYASLWLKKQKGKSFDDLFGEVREPR
jgi:DNA-binding MarR family transcriptional regulator